MQYSGQLWYFIFMGKNAAFTSRIICIVDFLVYLRMGEQQTSISLSNLWQFYSAFRNDFIQNYRDSCSRWEENSKVFKFDGHLYFNIRRHLAKLPEVLCVFEKLCRLASRYPLYLLCISPYFPPSLDRMKFRSWRHDPHYNLIKG